LESTFRDENRTGRSSKMLAAADGRRALNEQMTQMLVATLARPQRTLRPPVLCWRGTRPIKAATLRPPSNCEHILLRTPADLRCRSNSPATDALAATWTWREYLLLLTEEDVAGNAEWVKAMIWKISGIKVAHLMLALV
jgi:hypothetical protein